MSCDRQEIEGQGPSRQARAARFFFVHPAEYHGISISGWWFGTFYFSIIYGIIVVISV